MIFIVTFKEFRITRFLFPFLSRFMNVLFTFARLFKSGCGDVEVSGLVK